LKDFQGNCLIWSDLWKNRQVKQNPKVLTVVVVVGGSGRRFVRTACRG